ncbi:MAG: hypothetical protein ABEK01_00200 [Candidatus Nanohaloarchaea archaeon]
MVERQVDWEILLAAGIITVGIVAGIFFVGNQLSDYKIQSLRADIRKVELSQKSQNLGLQLVESVEGDRCRALKQWTRTSLPELRQLRKEVAVYERTRKLKNEQYTVLKKRYINLVIENMVGIKRMQKACDLQVIDVLYLYGDSNCEKCDRQGDVTTYFRRKYPERLVVHPVDATLNMKTVNFLKRYYNVTEYPTLVIEGETYSGFRSKSEMKDILEGYLKTANRTEAIDPGE